MNMLQKVNKLLADVAALKARINVAVSPAGKIIVTATNLAGGIWSHDHSDEANGGKVEYGPAIPSNWAGNQDPGDVWQALDQLALRIKQLEDLNAPAASFGAPTMLLNGIEG